MNPAFLTASRKGIADAALPFTITLPSAKTMSSAFALKTGASREASSRAQRYAALRAAGVRELVTRLPPEAGPIG